MSELKPCPFCGDENLTVTHHEEHWVFCNSCFAAGGMCPSVKSAKEDWNTRLAPELPEGYREGEDGDLWTDEEIMPTAMAYMEEDGSLAFNFTNYNASESAALFIWLQRRARL